MMLSVAEIVAEAIRKQGADGMCTDDGCGCGLDDLFPCGDGPHSDCFLARRLTVPESGDLIDPKDGSVIHHDGQPGDSVFVYL